MTEEQRNNKRKRDRESSKAYRLRFALEIKEREKVRSQQPARKAARKARNAKYNKTVKGKAVLRARWRRYSYGVTEQVYQHMWDKQDGLCGNPECGTFIVLNTRRCHIDHCHTTGRVRGLLCVKCNLLLGQIEKHATYLEGLQLYLARTNPPQSNVAGTVA